MVIRFETEALAKICNSRALLRKHWGSERGPLLEKCLSQLAAMPNLHWVAAIPGILTVPVRPNGRGEVIAAVLLPLRIVLRIDHNPVPLHQDGNARCKEIQNIVLLEVLDGEE
jgi:proteic killer suppression protein